MSCVMGSCGRRRRNRQQGFHAIQRGKIGQRLRGACNIKRNTDRLRRALPGQQHRQRRGIDPRQARAINAQCGNARPTRLAKLRLALAQHARRFKLSQRAGQGQHSEGGCVRKRNSGQRRPLFRFYRKAAYFAGPFSSCALRSFRKLTKPATPPRLLMTSANWFLYVSDSHRPLMLMSYTFQPLPVFSMR